nr:MAG TPA: hypothetical protein [Caudoviricetes sp.]
MAYTRARSTRPRRRAALPGNVHARVHRPAPRGSGRCSHGIHAPCRGGLCGAVRHGPGCRSACGLSNRPGLRVPATPSGHGTGGLGRPRSPRGRGRQNGWASRPPATRPEASRRTRDRTARMMSDGAGSRLERPERP